MDKDQEQQQDVAAKEENTQGNENTSNEKLRDQNQASAKDEEEKDTLK